ncbi:MAG TPA: O-antigen ligase family protein [Thermoanaerobaculia bacterium]|jgi:O-antigen ligase
MDEAVSPGGSVASGRPARIAWAIVVAAAVLIPVIGDFRGEDVFRTPKLSLLRAAGFLLAALWALWALYAPRTLPRLRWSSPDVFLPAAICGWTLLTSLTSTYPVLSVYSTATVIATAVLFLTTRAVGTGRSIVWAYVPLIGGVCNTVFLTLQVTRTWNPLLPPDADPKSVQAIIASLSALLGNPNDVGAVMVTLVILGLALGMAERNRTRRLIGFGGAVFALAAVVMSRNITAVITLTVAILTLTLLLDRKKAVAAVTLVAIVAATGYATYRPLRLRIRSAVVRAQQGRWDNFLSGRLVAHLSAAAMAKDHPLLGIGPGGFAPNYLPYKICTEHNHRGLFTRNRSGTPNFGETHNDHLQTLAETGVPGYLLMLAAIAALAAGSFRRRRAAEADGDPRRELVRILSLPLAVSLAVLSLAQFPLHLATSLMQYAYIAGLLCAWRDDARP